MGDIKLEWSKAAEGFSYTETRGEVEDSYGNYNEGPALMIGEASILEADSREDMIGFLEAALEQVKNTPDNDHTFLVAFEVKAADRAQAQKMLHEALLESPTFVTEWWIAEDDRIDRSDNDSAVFVPFGEQEQYDDTVQRFRATLAEQQGLMTDPAVGRKSPKAEQKFSEEEIRDAAAALANQRHINPSEAQRQAAERTIRSSIKAGRPYELLLDARRERLEPLPGTPTQDYPRDDV